MNQRPMCDDCEQVAQTYDLDIDRLLFDLGRVKGELRNQSLCALSVKEKFFLCLSLLGYQPQDIARIERERELWLAEDLQERTKNIRKEISAKLNEYLKDLINHSDDISLKQELAERKRMFSWLRILSFLLSNGYRKPYPEPENKITIEMTYQGQPDLRKFASFLQETTQNYGSEVLKINTIEAK